MGGDTGLHGNQSYFYLIIYMTINIPHTLSFLVRGSDEEGEMQGQNSGCREWM